MADQPLLRPRPTPTFQFAPSPISLTFRDVCYRAPSPKKAAPPLEILQHVNGHIAQGQFLSIMGPSGAGKTSLMDVLAGRQKTGTVSGQIFANGGLVALGTKDDAWFKRHSGYVFQDDVFVANLTVRETLNFSLELRVEKDKIEAAEQPQSRKELIVQRIVDVLGLRKCADSRIGSQLKRGISGGERKRVNIGCELVTSPGILFIDEPTSGLDSTSAYRVMRAIKNLCKSGTTVVCTIHQPRSNIFLMFDQLLLLCGGETVYFGHALKSVEYFGRLGFTCPAFLNPGDFLLDILEESKAKEEEAAAGRGGAEGAASAADASAASSGSSLSAFNPLRLLGYGAPARDARRVRDEESAMDAGNDDEAEYGSFALPVTAEEARMEAKLIRSTERIPEVEVANAELGQSEVTPRTLACVFRNSAENAQLQALIKTVSEEAVALDDEEHAGEYPISFWRQFVILLRRTWLATLRDPGVMYVRTLTVFGIGLLVGVIFFDQPDDSVGNRTNGILFDMCVFSLITLPSVSQLIDDRLLFTRERAGGYYRTSAYFLSNFFVELPLLVFLVAGYSTISYWMIGLQPTAANFLFFFGAVQFVVLIMFSLTQLIASLARTVNVALAVYFIVLVYSLLLGGFIVGVDDLPEALQWALYTSYFYYGFSALAVNEYESTGYGRQALEGMGLADVDKFMCLYVLIGVVVALRIATYCVLRFVHTEKR